MAVKPSLIVDTLSKANDTNDCSYKKLLSHCPSVSVPMKYSVVHSKRNYQAAAYGH